MLRVILSPLRKVLFKCAGRHAALLFLGAILVLAAAASAQSKPVEQESQDQVSKEDSHANPLELQGGSGAQGPLPHGPIHIVPYGPPAAPLKKPGQPIGELSNNGTVQYFGGPVISNVQVVEVLWGSFVDPSSTTGLEQFFTDITQSNYFGLLAQYSTTGLSGLGGAPGTNQIIGPGTFLSPRITITPSTCPGSATNTPCSISDSQIQSEIASQLNAHHLPTPVQDSQGNFNTVYMIYFPPGVTISLAPGVNSCQRGGFCAYHSNLTLNLQPKLPYGIFPDFSQGGCAPAKGCGNGTAFQNLTSSSSHELAEAVTDVEVGSFNGNVPAPPLAWVDQNSGQEIGDFCNQNDGQITVNSNTYTVQRLLSNLESACVLAPPHFNVAPATNSVVPGVPFQVTVAATGSLFNFTLGAYNDIAHFTSSDPAAVLPADYTYVPNTDNGSHTFTVTLNTTGTQTITAADTIITGMVGSGSVDIEHNPDLGVSLAHSGSFRQGDTGDTYTLTVTNIGDLPTNGTPVQVNFLPFGFTTTAMAGGGWNCTLGNLTCTRTDAVAAHTSYPSITLTVSVATNAPPTITPIAQVSGGGELNTSNDQASDPTTIIPMPDLVISKSHVGSFAQGQLGVNYTLTVSNAGGGATSGTVTVTDTLPTGLTATAISGTGWTCSTPPTLNCSRTDVLAGFFAFYPPITLTVNVDPAAPMPTVTNVANVSGGGEINTQNDAASDQTVITVAASDLAVTSSHSGSFQQGQIGAVYTLTVTNIGSLATSGAVTVNDLLPFGLTATSIGGTGWSCTLANLTCTRSDALGANGATYPPITLTVNVSVTAGSSAPNTVSVSGGGELNTANDTSTDVATVIQFANLVISKFHSTQFAQGQTGAMYFLNVSNIGFAPAVGTITVTDNLPSGLTATAISGSGWNCTLSTVTCTRSDAFSNYPQITVTVNVALNAPSSVTNTAAVSGGGEIITSDDTASDPTSINPPLTMPSNLGTGSVAAGGSVTFVFGMNSSLPGTVNLSCSSGVPPGAKCTFVPPSSGQGFTSVFLTISTTPPGLSKLAASKYDEKPPLGALLLAGFAVAAFVMVRLGGRNVRIRLAATAAGAVLLLIGCGGGGAPPPPPPPVATPPGTYTITVTATNATTSSANASSTLTLNVH
jgi:uncharacterized repeat protein (TIGR01451 family)